MSKSFKSCELTLFAGIKITTRHYHVSLDSNTNRLVLSQNDPVLMLYKHSDGTIRDQEEGTRCLRLEYLPKGISLTGKFSFAKSNQ